MTKGEEFCAPLATRYLKSKLMGAADGRVSANMQNFKTSWLGLLFGAIFSIGCVSANAETMGQVLTSKPDKIQRGNIALLDTKNNRVIELDGDGTIVWQTEFPDSFQSGNWNGGADIEWLTDSDTFLVAVPMAGFFEIDRSGKVLAQCKSAFISHDVDKLDDGSFIFVNGWDDKGKDEAVVTFMDQNCNVLWSNTATFFGLKEVDLQPHYANDKAKLHTNSIRLLRDGSYMVSIRNYDQIVIFNEGGVIKRFKDAPGVHDPSEVFKEGDNEYFYYANRGPFQSLNKRDFINPDRKSKIIWSGPRDRKRAWKPLRTIEKLPNGNWLVTGSKEVGQVTEDGELVWELYFPEFRHQKNKEKEKTYIFKAAFVNKLNN